MKILLTLFVLLLVSISTNVYSKHECFLAEGACSIKYSKEVKKLSSEDWMKLTKEKRNCEFAKRLFGENPKDCVNYNKHQSVKESYEYKQCVKNSIQCKPHTFIDKIVIIFSDIIRRFF